MALALDKRVKGDRRMSAKLLKLINDERTLISVLKAKMCVNNAPVIDYYCGVMDIASCHPDAALDQGCEVKDLAGCPPDVFDYICYHDMVSCSNEAHDTSCRIGDYSACDNPTEID